MARATIVSVSISDNGYNLTDSSGFATLGTGAGNGVSFAYDAHDVVVLKNDSGGAAVYTIKVPTPEAFSAKGLTIPDETVTVATGKTWLYPLSSIFKQSDDNVYIDCDVAGKVLVLAR